jgi:hypothetical protein
MYFIQYEVSPNPGATKLHDYGNTLALCWIRRAVQAEADLQARNSISEAGWDVLYMIEAFPTALKDHAPDHPAHRSCEIAEQKGECIIFVTAPRHE